MNVQLCKKILLMTVKLCTNAYHAMERIGGTLSITLKTPMIARDTQQSPLSLPPPANTYNLQCLTQVRVLGLASSKKFMSIFPF